MLGQLRPLLTRCVVVSFACATALPARANIGTAAAASSHGVNGDSTKAHRPTATLDSARDHHEEASSSCGQEPDEARVASRCSTVSAWIVRSKCSAARTAGSKVMMTLRADRLRRTSRTPRISASTLSMATPSRAKTSCCSTRMRRRPWLLCTSSQGSDGGLGNAGGAAGMGCVPDKEVL